MKTTGSTIVIADGGSGIGPALAENLHTRGNRGITAGQSRSLF